MELEVDFVRLFVPEITPVVKEMETSSDMSIKNYLGRHSLGLAGTFLFHLTATLRGSYCMVMSLLQRGKLQPSEGEPHILGHTAGVGQSWALAMGL